MTEVQESDRTRPADGAAELALWRLRDAQRVAQIGDWEFDLVTEAISWSPQVFEILGRDPRLGPPKDYEENSGLYDAASVALMTEKVAEAIALGEAQDYELVAVRPNGERVIVHARAVPRKDESGRARCETGFRATPSGARLPRDSGGCSRSCVDESSVDSDSVVGACFARFAAEALDGRGQTIEPGQPEQDAVERLACRLLPISAETWTLALGCQSRFRPADTRFAAT